MKVENNGTTPISPKRTDGIQPAGKKTAGQVTRSTISGKDRAEVTDAARLLAKARAALENDPAGESERVELLKQQVQNGTYQIPVEELAKRILASRHLWDNSGVE